MSIFNKMKEPVFLKESSDAQRQLAMLKELEPKLSPEGQKKIRQDIKYLEYGIMGENQIAYELKNSHMPMYILHDIYLEAGDLSAQIDYIVVTRKMCFLIECKNLFGNIEINSKGEFIRTLENGGRKIKEGIYSPITQNERHLELLKFIKTEAKGNVITRFMAGKYFGDFYKAVVVLANPKTVLNDKYAKKEVKNKVIRGDQLITYIKDQCKLSKELEYSDEGMKSWAESFMKLHKEIEKDYTQKYQPFLLPVSEGAVPVPEAVASVSGGAAPVPEKIAPVSGGVAPASGEAAADLAEIVPDNPGQATADEAGLIDELKAYRLDKSREEKIKPYYIFNNNQMADLIAKMPASKQELQTVSGFGPVKAEKYGDDILRIVKKYDVNHGSV